MRCRLWSDIRLLCWYTPSIISIHYPLSSDVVTGFSDSNLGPLDASWLKSQSKPPKQYPSLFRSISGSVILLSCGSIPWGGGQHQEVTALTSCEAEITATNETVKSILKLHILLRDLNLPYLSNVPVYNDNKGAVAWCKVNITKETNTLTCRKILWRKILTAILTYATYLARLI